MSYLTSREHIYHSLVAALTVFGLNVARGDIWPQAFADGALVGSIVYLIPSLATYMRRRSRGATRVYNGMLDEADGDPDDQ